jgi:hypothetical protein
VPSPIEVISWAPIEPGLVLVEELAVVAVLAAVEPVVDEEIVVMARRTADGGAD